MINIEVRYQCGAMPNRFTDFTDIVFDDGADLLARKSTDVPSPISKNDVVYYRVWFVSADRDAGRCV